MTSEPVAAINADPTEPDLLRTAVDDAVQAGSEDALRLAERLAIVDPSGASLRMLGLARLSEGDLEGAERALCESLRLTPDDAEAAQALGHLHLHAGRDREAVHFLERAAAAEPDDAEIVANLVDLHRDAQRLRKAITWAERLLTMRPDEPVVRLDNAELSMALNEHDEAADHFCQLGQLDRGPGRRIFSLHGMIEAHIRGDHLRAALDLAITASNVDREELTTDALAFLVAEVFGDGRTSTLSRGQLLEGFAMERARYRAVLTDTGVM